MSGGLFLGLGSLLQERHWLTESSWAEATVTELLYESCELRLTQLGLFGLEKRRWREGLIEICSCLRKARRKDGSIVSVVNTRGNFPEMLRNLSLETFRTQLDMAQVSLYKVDVQGELQRLLSTIIIPFPCFFFFHPINLVKNVFIIYKSTQGKKKTTFLFEDSFYCLFKHRN